MKRFTIIYGVLFVIGAILTKGYTYLYGEFQAGITAGIWVLFIITFFPLFFVSYAKRCAENATDDEVIPFQDEYLKQSKYN